jgi:hypothetical protein
MQTLHCCQSTIGYSPWADKICAASIRSVEEAAVAEDFSSHIAADLGELRDIAGWIRREADSLVDGEQHLAPAVYFGQYSPCGESHAARRATTSALHAYRDRWEHHRQQLAAFAALLEKAVDNYSASDTFRKPSR